MRLLIVLLVVGLLAVAPSVEADENGATPPEPAPTSGPDSGSGPDPTGCRPYCFAT